MPAPRVLTPDMEPEILAQYGKGRTGDQIAAWLKETHGIKVSGRAVRQFIDKKRRERRPITEAVVQAKLSKTVTADLDAVDGILDRARKDELAAGKNEDVVRELERLAMVDIGQAFDEQGALKQLKDMPAEVRRAIASIEVDQIDTDGKADDGEFSRSVGRVVKVKFWDKVRGLDLLSKMRSTLATREMALKARDQQLRALALRLELAGAGPKKEDSEVAAIRSRLEARLDAEAATKD